MGYVLLDVAPGLKRINVERFDLKNNYCFVNFDREIPIRLAFARGSSGYYACETL